MQYYFEYKCLFFFGAIYTKAYQISHIYSTLLILYFEPSGLIPLLMDSVPDGINQPSCQTCLTLNLSNNVLQTFTALLKF